MPQRRVVVNLVAQPQGEVGVAHHGWRAAGIVADRDAGAVAIGLVVLEQHGPLVGQVIPMPPLS